MGDEWSSGARGDVGRSGLRHRRGPGGGRGSRGDRRPSGAVRQPEVLPDRGPRLLHAGGRPGRAPGRRRDRHPVLRLGHGRALPPRRGRGFRRRVRRGPHPEPVPALQREDQVRGGAGPRAGPRLRRGVHRPLRPHLRRGPAPGRRSRQGPVLRAGRAHLRAARPRPVPARRHAQGPGPRRGGTTRPGRRGQAGQPRRLLHRRRRHQGLPGPAPGPGPRPDRRHLRRRPRRARRRLRLHRRPAQGPGCRHPRPTTAAPGTCSTSSP